MDKEKTIPPYSIEYLKSYFSINSIVGCTVDCAYCFLSPLGISPSKPRKVIDEESLVDRLEESEFFIPHETVLSLNNRTEPFLNKFTTESTLKIMYILDQRKLRNPVTVTSKGKLSKETVSFIDNLREINPFIIVTNSGLPKEVEPLGHKGQIETMKNVRDYSERIHLLHQFRPIIQGINDSEEVMKDVLSKAQEYCDGSIVSGLRMTQFIRDRIIKSGVKLDMPLSPDHKLMDNDFRKRVYGFIKETYPEYPIFSETSCAISWRLDISDINGYWSKGEEKGICDLGCPNHFNCYDRRPKPNIKKISNLLKVMNIDSKFEIKENQIFIYGSISQEQRSYLRHKNRFPIKSSSITKSESEKVISP